MLNQHKNVEGFLRVVKKLESKIADFKVQLIGENSFRYKEFAKKINLDSTKIEFVDQIPHTEIVTHLQNSSLFVLFSNYENLPCVILESFACGTPVVASNVGGISEFFPNEFGFLVPPKDESTLFDRILTMYMSFNANKKEMHKYVVENFSENKIASDFEKLYFKSLKP